MESTTFTVDAALLRELGERLIGRSYIALAELVKNSYDADATNCTIEFSAKEIIVTDNGHGISEQEFHDYWMRIGTTHKSDTQTSKRLGRPMTGSKGLGRLSVQFLADEMTLESTSVAAPSRHLYAFVDWTDIRRGTDIDTVDVLWEMRPGKSECPSGTRIVLKVLRSTWATDEIGKLGEQVWMLQSPYRRSDRWSDGTPQDFIVDINAPDIERAREAFGKFYDALFCNWKARIRGRLVDGRSGPSQNTRATVSVEFQEGYPKNVDTEDVTLPVDPGKSTASAIDRADFEIPTKVAVTPANGLIITAQTGGTIDAKAIQNAVTKLERLGKAWKARETAAVLAARPELLSKNAATATIGEDSGDRPVRITFHRYTDTDTVIAYERALAKRNGTN